MGNLQSIEFDRFETKSFSVWGKGWLLLAAGDFESGNYNAMTVGWGFFGTMWAMPAVMAVVRPQRYTMEFLERYDSFTLSAFPEERREALTMLGNTSGRAVPDKLARAGLTPIRSEKVDAPSFAEAEMTLECRKLYCGRFIAKEFCDKSLIERCYGSGDLHNTIIGEVKRAAGTDKYRKSDF
ncbi:MAG: flavin reductase [Victivallaceae bacterium]|nr:flavin reductase [Victivallaceae bacterium]